MPRVPDEVLPEDGKVTFEDGDWVQFPVKPTHGQSRIVTRAVVQASQAGMENALDCMAPTVAALAISGMLTDERAHEAIAFPFTEDGLDRVSADKVQRLFSLALSIRNLIPNPPRPR